MSSGRLSSGRRLAQHRQRPVPGPVTAPATIVAYDPAWPGLFRLLGSRIDVALVTVDHRTEHVGSTAVTGLDARPIIDIDVVVRDRPAISEVTRGLSVAGWRRESDRGLAGPLALAPPPDAPYHQLSVVCAGSKPHRDHVDLRDYLRARPDEAARYAALKGRLAYLLATDRDAYADGKAELIGELLSRARSAPPRASGR